MITLVTIMVTLLKSGYWKIMRLFYSSRNTRYHLREIGRQTGMHEPSVSRFLKHLEKQGLLKSEMDGNQKKFSIINSKKTYLIFEHFDIERFEKLTSLRKKAINLYLDKLSQQPIFAILFGSTAKETYTKSSDIDILLVTNKKVSTKEAKKEVNSQTALKISTFQIEYKDFLIELKMREDKVAQSAINSGYPLINHIRFYEVLYERI